MSISAGYWAWLKAQAARDTLGFAALKDLVLPQGDLPAEEAVPYWDMPHSSMLFYLP